jgi:S-adenosylmethionine hydrolase
MGTAGTANEAATANWRPSRLVTLLTDFGNADPYVGMMKGVLWSAAPSLRAVVDLTHAVAPQDVAAGAFFLAHAWHYFPAGTVHVAVVDPGVGSERRLLAASAGGHAFLAPDNGLLSGVLADAAARRLATDVRQLDAERFALPRRSRTFHGRDVIAPAAAALIEGLAPAAAGPAAAHWRMLERPRAEPGANGGEVRGTVLFCDHYGNLITNVARGDLPPAGETGDGAGPAEASQRAEPAFEVALSGGRARLRGTYADAAPGEIVALWNSYGLLEIALRDGNAARRLGLGPGAPILMRPVPHP